MEYISITMPDLFREGHWAKLCIMWKSDSRMPYLFAENLGRISAVTVIPGYDDTKIRKPGLKVKRLDGELYRQMWDMAIRLVPDWVLITSFNEWHEGSEIETSLEHGDLYVDFTSIVPSMPIRLTHKYLTKNGITY